MIIWRFKDGILGHENQTMGLVEALKKQRELQVYDIPSSSLPTSLSLLFSALFRKKIHAFPPVKPDLIVGAGHKTHIPMVVARSQRGGKSVLLMRPSIPMGLFDLVVTPRHDNVSPRKNVIETEGALNVVQFVKSKDRTKGMMLIGGVSKHFVWDDAEIVKQIKQIAKHDREVDWTLTTSRRTPDSFLKILKDQCNDSNVHVLPEIETNQAWMDEHYAKSGQIWVTPDSVSMVYEALSSGAVSNVFSLEPTRNYSRVREGIDGLELDGSITPFNRWIENPEVVNNSRVFNEAARIADYVVEHLI